VTLPMIEGLPLAAQAQFKVLQQTFVASLGQRQLEIETATTAEARQAALHRLCGSAGSFGFERLSQCARVAEALARSDRHEDLASALVLLKAEIDIAQSTAQAGNPANQP